MADKDFYKVLGVSRGASADEIEKAYRKVAKANHPDMNPDDRRAEERFKEANAAFDVLGDADKRKLYDEFGKDGLREGFDPAQTRAYQQWASRRGGQGGFNVSSGGSGFDFGDIGSVFGDLFSRQRRPAGPRKGRDIEASVAVDLLTAIRGGEVTLRLDGHSAESLNVRIPAGITDGGRLRLGGKGSPGAGGGPAGDLLLNITVSPHPTIEREGNDLHMKLPVTIGEALLGGRVELATPDGSSVTMTVPKRSQNGRRLRLKGKGAPDVKSGNRGDLYVILDVRLPSSDDAEVDALASSLEAHYRDEASRPTQL